MVQWVKVISDFPQDLDLVSAFRDSVSWLHLLSPNDSASCPHPHIYSSIFINKKVTVSFIKIKNMFLLTQGISVFNYDKYMQTWQKINKQEHII